jgi:hypothetical protein
MFFTKNKIGTWYKNDNGDEVVIAEMNGPHLVNAYTKYLARAIDGEFIRYNELVNALKKEILRRLK